MWDTLAYVWIARLIFVIVLGVGLARAQAGLVATGSVDRNGQARHYTVRHLPVSAFPELPAVVARGLTARGCAVPQTYEAHGPENVIRGSFERAGSEDWAALCSVDGNVSLLVFFASDLEKPAELATAPETARLQPGNGGELGFNWAIDPATPERVQEAQKGMFPRPERLEHDAVADSVIEREAVYRYFANGAWGVVPLP